MAFWGVEVKPGEPFTLSCEKARGRLRISRATLGPGEASKTCGESNKITVQCSVGNKRPVWLCVLLANKKESCQLGLEFDEADDVVFSVIGFRSVFLCGHYVYRNHQSNSHGDTESYGVDIENSETDGSSYHSDDDMYEDSFINDDNEIKVPLQSPLLSNKGTDAVTPEKEKSQKTKGHGKQLEKNHQAIESDHGANSLEDGDGFISVHKMKISGKTTMNGEKIAQATEQTDDVAKDDGLCGMESKQKDNPLDINGKLEGEENTSLEEKTEVNEEENEILEEEEALEKVIVAIQDAIHGINSKDTNLNQNLLVSNGKDQSQSLEIAKSKKKRKGYSANGEKAKRFQTDNEDHSVLREDKELEVDATPNLGLDETCVLTYPDSGCVKDQKSQKRRKEHPLKGSLTERIGEKCYYSPQEDIFEQGSGNADGVVKAPPGPGAIEESKTANWGSLQLLSHLCGEYLDQQELTETSTEGIEPNCHKMPRDDEATQEPVAEIMAEDVPAANGEKQQLQINNHITTEPESLANDKQHDKKNKKTRKKTKGDIVSNEGLVKMTDNQETMPTKYDDQSSEMLPLQTRTLSNGLIIEELTRGPPNGAVAAPNKRAKVHYTAMVKESEHFFESSTLKFRLGDEEIIDGVNLGVEGMHVGDKRRLVIPPSLGFGDCEVENVPPNSWLVYDIELVNVYK